MLQALKSPEKSISNVGSGSSSRAIRRKSRALRKSLGDGHSHGSTAPSFLEMLQTYLQQEQQQEYKAEDGKKDELSADSLKKENSPLSSTQKCSLNYSSEVTKIDEHKLPEHVNINITTTKRKHSPRVKSKQMELSSKLSNRETATALTNDKLSTGRSVNTINNDLSSSLKRKRSPRTKVTRTEASSKPSSRTALSRAQTNDKSTTDKSVNTINNDLPSTSKRRRSPRAKSQQMELSSKLSNRETATALTNDKVSSKRKLSLRPKKIQVAKLSPKMSVTRTKRPVDKMPIGVIINTGDENTSVSSMRRRSPRACTVKTEHSSDASKIIREKINVRTLVDVGMDVNLSNNSSSLTMHKRVSKKKVVQKWTSSIVSFETARDRSEIMQVSKIFADEGEHNFCIDDFPKYEVIKEQDGSLYFKVQLHKNLPQNVISAGDVVFMNVFGVTKYRSYNSANDKLASTNEEFEYLKSLHPSLARIEKFWIDPTKTPNVNMEEDVGIRCTVRWFHNKSDLKLLFSKACVEGVDSKQKFLDSLVHEYDLVLGDFVDENSAACILGKANIDFISYPRPTKFSNCNDHFRCRYMLQQHDPRHSIFRKRGCKKIYSITPVSACEYRKSNTGTPREHRTTRPCTVTPDCALSKMDNYPSVASMHSLAALISDNASFYDSDEVSEAEAPEKTKISLQEHFDSSVDNALEWDSKPNSLPSPSKFGFDGNLSKIKHIYNEHIEEQDSISSYQAQDKELKNAVSLSNVNEDLIGQSRANDECREEVKATLNMQPNNDILLRHAIASESDRMNNVKDETGISRSFIFARSGKASIKSRRIAKQQQRIVRRILLHKFLNNHHRDKLLRSLMKKAIVIVTPAVKRKRLNINDVRERRRLCKLKGIKRIKHTKSKRKQTIDNIGVDRDIKGQTENESETESIFSHSKVFCSRSNHSVVPTKQNVQKRRALSGGSSVFDSLGRLNDSRDNHNDTSTETCIHPKPSKHLKRLRKWDNSKISKDHSFFDDKHRESSKVFIAQKEETLPTIDQKIQNYERRKRKIEFDLHLMKKDCPNNNQTSTLSVRGSPDIILSNTTRQMVNSFKASHSPSTFEALDTIRRMTYLDGAYQHERKIHRKERLQQIALMRKILMRDFKPTQNQDDDMDEKFNEGDETTEIESNSTEENCISKTTFKIDRSTNKAISHLFDTLHNSRCNDAVFVEKYCMNCPGCLQRDCGTCANCLTYVDGSLNGSLPICKNKICFQFDSTVSRQLCNQSQGDFSDRGDELDIKSLDGSLQYPISDLDEDNDEDEESTITMNNTDIKMYKENRIPRTKERGMKPQTCLSAFTPSRQSGADLARLLSSKQRSQFFYSDSETSGDDECSSSSVC